MQLRLILPVLLVLQCIPVAFTADVPALTPKCQPQASLIDKIVCNDQELASIDDEISYMYSILIASLKGDERSALENAQRLWLSERLQKCRLRSKRVLAVQDVLHTRSCLIEVYKTRSADLSKL